MLGEDIEKIGVLAPKILLEVRQQFPHLLFRKRLDAADDLAGPLHIAGAEQPGDNSARIRVQMQRQSRDGNAHRLLRGEIRNSSIEERGRFVVISQVERFDRDRALAHRRCDDLTARAW